MACVTPAPATANIQSGEITPNQMRASRRHPQSRFDEGTASRRRAFEMRVARRSLITPLTLDLDRAADESGLLDWSRSSPYKGRQRSDERTRGCATLLLKCS